MKVRTVRFIGYTITLWFTTLLVWGLWLRYAHEGWYLVHLLLVTSFAALCILALGASATESAVDHVLRGGPKEEDQGDADD